MRVKRALGIVAGVVGKLTAFLVALLVIMRWLGESSLSLLQVIGILGVVYGLVGGIQVRGWLQVGAAAFIVPFLVFGWIGWRADFVSADCVETNGKVRVVSGVECMIAHVRAFRTMLPDLCITAERQIAEGDWVVTEITARGTHLGELFGIRPTGRDLVVSGVNVDRVMGGRIVEHGGAANMLEPLLEAGAVHVSA